MLLSCKRLLFTKNNSFQNLRFLSTNKDFLVNKLRDILGYDNVSIASSVLEQHGKDEGPFNSVPPDIVTWPNTTEQVSQIVKLCYDSNVPIIPFGTGTGLEGGVNAINGGVCVDLNRMNKVLEVNQEDFDCTVEPCVTWRDLNQYLRDTGLWFPVDPGASASLAGMISTSASGTNAVHYGTVKENVLNLEVVLPNGTVIKTSGINTRSRKSSAGYNLTGLFVGSEGTLGVITKITLKLHAIPSSIATAVCSFPSDQSAIDTVINILQSNISMARIEFVDSLSMEACKSYSQIPYEIAPTLFLEFNGSNDYEVNKRAECAKEIVSANGGSNFEWATDLESRNQLWHARHNLYYACRALRPNNKCLITDVCVPISKLTQMIVKTKEDIQRSGLLGPLLGHVGDGNFHTQLLFNPDSLEEYTKAQKLEHHITVLALSLGGTCTGEHGIGRGKIQLLREQFGDQAIETMKTIKRAFDPKNLMNPGKLF